MDYRLALMCGTDIPTEYQLTIHQPTLQEISFIGEQDFFLGAQCLTLNKSMFIEDKNALLTTNNFQIFMMIMQEKEAKDQKRATQQILTLLFPNYKVLFTPNSLLFQSNNHETVIVDENNFEPLQEIFRLIFCAKNGPMDQQAFKPGSKKAQEIAKKLMRGRERIAAEKNLNTASVFSQYISMLSVGLHLPVQNLVELTMFQLYDLVERFMLWLNWDIDIKSRLAGGKPDKEPDNWMKNLH